MKKFVLIKRWKLFILISMSKNPQKKCQYRKEGCGLSYTLPHNCLKHEKLIGDMPLKWRDRNESLHDAELKMFKCSFPNCSVSSKQKSNLKRHMTTCQAIKKRKHSKLTCSNCKLKFSQKSSHTRHIKNIHQEDTLVFVQDVTEADENTFNDVVYFILKKHMKTLKQQKVMHSQWMGMITHLKITMMKSWMPPLSVTLARLWTSKYPRQGHSYLSSSWKWWTVQ